MKQVYLEEVVELIRVVELLVKVSKCPRKISDQSCYRCRAIKYITKLKKLHDIDMESDGTSE